MNQILSVEAPKKNKKVRGGNRGPADIEKILKLFAIVMLIFGIFMISSGSYAMYQNSKNIGSSAKPTIYIEETSATAITIQVSHNKELSKVTYYWNNQEPTEIECKGKKKVEQKIDIPTGKNTLTINAVDVNGLESKTQKQYTVQGDISIDVKVEGNTLKINAEGNEQLSYLTYRWDEEEETRVDINDNSIETSVSVPVGLHKLTVVVVDTNNKTETVEQEVKGVSKPKVEVTTDGSDYFIIIASDEEGLKKIEFIINETDKNRINLENELPLEERKEFRYKYEGYKLREGENKIEVRVYNESDISEVFKARVNK